MSRASASRRAAVQSPHADPVPRSYSKIVVGYDGSKNAARALERAAQVASQSGASLRIVVVVNTLIHAYGPPDPYIPQEYFDRMFDEGEAALADATTMCKKLTDDVSGSVEEGHPAETLLDVARNEGADLIVVGRRGISGVERFLLGGVSSSVVGNSSCDVLVVK